MSRDASPSVHPLRKVRATDSIVDRDRRAFLKTAVAQGIAAPVALAVLDRPALANQSTVQQAIVAPARKGAMRLSKSETDDLHDSGAIVRDFVNPYLELLRLLREAAEIEHALMLQYLFCAFSLRDPYSDLAGYGSVTPDNMIGVAIQEMQHLSAVNRLLVALGSCPHLDRQDFPYEPDIYPFNFQLEPLSKTALAKYVYTEAPADIFNNSVSRNKEDKAFADSVLVELGAGSKANQVGSLYQSVLDMLAEVAGMPDGPLTADEAAKWKEELVRIMVEGQTDHFNFFRNTFEAKHPAFGGKTNAWSLSPADVKYPSHNIAWNPTAYIGHPNQIETPQALVLAWLGNLHYWISLSTLDFAYRTGDDGAINHATAQMTSALWPIATELPRHQAGIPFDPLSMGYALGANPKQTKRIIAAFGKEALSFAELIEHRLPENYDKTSTEDLIAYMST